MMLNEERIYSLSWQREANQILSNMKATLPYAIYGYCCSLSTVLFVRLRLLSLASATSRRSASEPHWPIRGAKRSLHIQLCRIDWQHASLSEAAICIASARKDLCFPDVCPHARNMDKFWAIICHSADLSAGLASCFEHWCACHTDVATRR
jgi:hypothetical protein